MASKPVKGFVRNPLLGLPRNEPCPCRSGKKFKACCLPTIAEQAFYIPENVAASYEKAMHEPDFMFMTEANKEDAFREMAERRARCQHDWEDITIPAVGSHGEEKKSVCRKCYIDSKTLYDAMKAVAQDGGNVEIPQ